MINIFNYIKTYITEPKLWCGVWSFSYRTSIFEPWTTFRTIDEGVAYTKYHTLLKEICRLKQNKQHTR